MPVTITTSKARQDHVNEIILTSALTASSRGPNAVVIDVPDTESGAPTLAAVLAVSNVASARIVTLTDPTNAQDAATKHYVDAAIPLIIPLPRIAAGVPSGAPTAGENGMAIDTTAVSGGVYGWSGSAWVKGATI